MAFVGPSLSLSVSLRISECRGGLIFTKLPRGCVVEAERLAAAGRVVLEEGLLGKRRHAGAVAGLLAFVVPAGNVLGDAIVPKS